MPASLALPLPAEMVASLCDLGVFICGIILIAKPRWSGEQRRAMGTAMLIMQVSKQQQ
jgi:hypothetical protein